MYMYTTLCIYYTLYVFVIIKLICILYTIIPYIKYCMQQFSADKLSLDHVVPRARGGKLVWTNTVTACFECNFKKGMCIYSVY